MPWSEKRENWRELCKKKAVGDKKLADVFVAGMVYIIGVLANLSIATLLLY